MLRVKASRELEERFSLLSTGFTLELRLPVEEAELGFAAGESHEVNARLEQGAEVCCRQGLGLTITLRNDLAVG